MRDPDVQPKKLLQFSKLIAFQEKRKRPKSSASAMKSSHKWSVVADVT
jgi:hypothetical protein